MMLKELSILLVMFLATPKQVSAGGFRIQTTAPSQEFCMYCKTDDACASYASNSICKRGQCTNDDGQFGLGCGCQGEDECASGRCDGRNEKTCIAKVGIGKICNEGSDCKSGHCSNLRLCAKAVAKQEPSTEELPAEEEPIERDDAVTEATEAMQDASTPIKGCLVCTDSSNCGGGSCVGGLCADASGVHPPACINCRGDDDCVQGFFCHGQNGHLSRTGKKCATKRVNGAKCARDEACGSGHCNVLFRCDSTASEHLSNDTDTTGAFFSGHEVGQTVYSDMAIWASIVGAVVMFVVSVAVFCSKGGHKRCFRPRGKRDEHLNHTLDSGSSDIGKRERLESDTLDSHCGSLDIEKSGECSDSSNRKLENDDKL